MTTLKKRDPAMWALVRLLFWASVAGVVVLMLAGCGSTQGEQPVSAVVHVETQTVQVPVPVPCVTKDVAPLFPLSSTKQLVGLDNSGYQTVMGYDRELQIRDQYEADLKAQLAGCQKVPAGQPPSPPPSPAVPAQ